MFNRVLIKQLNMRIYVATKKASLSPFKRTLGLNIRLFGSQEAATVDLNAVLTSVKTDRLPSVKTFRLNTVACFEDLRQSMNSCLT